MAESLPLLEELGTKSHKVLLDFLSRPADEHSDQMMKVARIATSLISRWSSAEATKNAHNRMTITLGQRITKNPEELQNYLRITLPGSQWTDAIESVVEARRQSIEGAQSISPA